MRYSVLKLSALLAIALCISPAYNIAQKKGKPDLKSIKEVVKKAKKGDADAMLLVAERCRGGLFTSAELRDYEEAKEWYREAYLKLGKLPQEAALGIFTINFTGGYGVERNWKSARPWLHMATEEPLIKVYPDRPDIEVGDIFEDHVKAERGNAKARLKMARQLVEFKMDYKKGFEWLKKAAEEDSLPDALYTYEKWKYSRRNYGKIVKNQYDSKLLSIMEEYAGTSLMARLELGYLLGYDTQAPRKTEEEIREILAPFLVNNSKLPVSQKLKAHLILAQFIPKKSGKKRLEILRKIELLARNCDIERYAFAKPYLNEYGLIAEKMHRYHGLDSIAKEYDLDAIPTDVHALETSFDGNVQGITGFFAALNQPECKAFMDASHIASLQREMNERIPIVLDAADNFSKLIAFEEALKNDPYLSSFRSTYSSKVKARFAELGIPESKVKFYYAQKDIFNKKFASVADAESEISRIADNPEYTAAQKDQLKEALSAKVIADLTSGKSPREMASALRSAKRKHPWLAKQADELIFRAETATASKFTGKIRRGGLIYYYEVNRLKGSKYKVNVKVITGGRANLAYSGEVEVQKHERDMEVNLPLAEYKGYRWEISDRDVLNARYTMAADFITPEAKGRMAQKQMPSGLPQLATTRSELPGDYSEQTAIRTTLKYFILEYNDALGM